MSIFAWVIMLGVICVPVAANYVLHIALKKPHSLSYTSLTLPVLCGIIYIAARMLPEPHITDESVTLAQHFVGGGFVSTLYFIYFIREFKVSLHPVWYFVLLYPFVSMMGATNELLEFASTKLGIYAVDGTDTWWDIAANTLGAYTLLIIALVSYKLFRRSLRS